MAVQFDIVAKLRADTKQFITGLKSGEAASTSFATSVGGAGNAVALGMAAGVVVAGAALMKLGASFNEAYKEIRIGTGATGDALKDLETSFKNVYSSTPASMAEVGMAIADINTKLGHTGPVLEASAEQFIKLSKITGDDLKGNIESVSMAFKNFGVSAEDQGGKLDLLYRAAQSSGLSVAELSDELAKNGVVLRQMGLDFDESTAIIGTFAKSGMTAADVMPGLAFAMKYAANESKKASDVFAETFQAIKDSPDVMSGAGIAVEVFGAKAGPKLAAAISEGKVSYEDYMQVLQDGSDTIQGSYKDVETFGDKLTIIGNQIKTSLEPLATTVFQGMNRALGLLMPVVSAATGTLKAMVDALNALPDQIKIVLPVIATLVLAMKAFAAMRTLMVFLQASFVKGFAAMAASTGQFVTTFLMQMGVSTAAAETAGLAIYAALGPIIILAGAAFIAFTIWNKSQEEGKKRAKEFGESLDQQTGAWTDNTDAVVRNQMQQKGVIDDLNTAGVGMETYRKAVEGGTKNIISQTAANKLRTAGLTNNLHATEGGTAAFAALKEEMIDSENAANIFMATLAEQGNLTAEIITMLTEEAKIYEEKAIVVQAAAVATGISNGLTKKAAEVAAEAATANTIQAKSIQDVMDKNLAATNPLFAALSAQRDAADAQKKLNVLRDEGKVGSDEYNRALEDSIRAGLSYADALTKMDVAQLKGETSSEKFQTAMATLTRLGLKPTDDDMKSLRERIEALYGPMNSLKEPSAAYTDILNKMKVDGMDPAKLSAGKYGEQLEALASTLDPNDPLRKNINDTMLQLFLIGQMKPVVDVIVNTDTKRAVDKLRAFLNITADQQLTLGDLWAYSQAYPDARAMGGPVQAGQPYIVGEVGPELFMPSASGRIIPNNALGRAAMAGSSGPSPSSASYAINVSVAPTADKAGIGQTIVEAISSFEKRSGTSWRSK